LCEGVNDVSYDLAFWRQASDMQSSPESIYEALVGGGHAVEGLFDLPIDEIMSAIVDNFPGAVRERNGPDEWVDWVSANGKDAFQVTWSRQHFLVTCRHVHSDDMNRLIDIGASFTCPLYDPQTSERFQISD
jgi:hypothetical protein